jgi:hypothetical protein
MLSKFVFGLVLAFTVISCQFTETMVLNEDGSGRMAIEMDLSEMMAFGGMEIDSVPVKMDTLISMKKFLEEKKDSIATLTSAQQKKLKESENYNIHMTMDTEASSMFVDVYIDFKNVKEANNLMNGLGQGLSQSSSFMPGASIDAAQGEAEEEESPEVVGIDFSFKNGVFKRDAYIIDEKQHQQEIDSMKSAEAFMSSMKYKLKYTFPKKILRSSVEDATYSLDGKTIELERNFIDYMKDPNVLDLEVEIEN